MRPFENSIVFKKKGGEKTCLYSWSKSHTYIAAPKTEFFCLTKFVEHADLQRECSLKVILLGLKLLQSIKLTNSCWQGSSQLVGKHVEGLF
jgi:hypothetical protein